MSAIPWTVDKSPKNPDASPVYDGIGWGDYWSAEDWVTWHAAMKARYGQEEANSRFLAAWRADTLLNSAPISARSFNSDFRAYARANGLLEALYSEGLGVVAKPLGAGNDVADGVSEAGAALKSAIPYAALIALGILLFALRARVSPKTR